MESNSEELKSKLVHIRCLRILLSEIEHEFFEARENRQPLDDRRAIEVQAIRSQLTVAEHQLNRMREGTNGR